jgi:hypothetical protein
MARTRVYLLVITLAAVWNMTWRKAEDRVGTHQPWVSKALAGRVMVARDPRLWVHLKTKQFCQVWWCMTLIPALKGQRQEDFYDSEASLVYKWSSRIA